MSAHRVGTRVALRKPDASSLTKGGKAASITINPGALGMIVGQAGTHAVVVFDEIGGTVGVNVPTAWLRILEWPANPCGAA